MFLSGCSFFTCLLFTALLLKSKGFTKLLIATLYFCVNFYGYSLFLLLAGC